MIISLCFASRPFGHAGFVRDQTNKTLPLGFEVSTDFVEGLFVGLDWKGLNALGEGSGIP